MIASLYTAGAIAFFVLLALVCVTIVLFGLWCWLCRWPPACLDNAPPEYAQPEKGLEEGRAERQEQEPGQGGEMKEEGSVEVE